MNSDKIPKKEILTIEVEDWERICAESDGANKLLNDPQFSFFREYLANTKKSILEALAKDIAKDLMVTTVDQFGNSSSKKTTKYEQLEEMSGKYKLVEKIFGDLGAFASQKEEYEKKAKEGQVIIAVSKEDAPKPV